MTSPAPTDQELIDFVYREARLIDQHRRYTWVEHEKIRHIRELHSIEKLEQS